MNEKEAGKGFNRSTGGWLLRQRRIAMTCLGFMVAASIMVAGCGTAKKGSATLQQAPYVIALSQPAGSVPGSLYALSPTTGTVQSLSLGTGAIPNSMLLDGNNLYVVNAGDATISVITISETTSNIYITDTNTIQLPSASYPEYMTVTTVNGMHKGYVTLNGTNQVAVLNLDKNTVLGYITITSYTTWPSSFQTHPWGIAMVNGKVMVANNGADYAASPAPTYTQPAMISVIEPASNTLLTPVTTTTGINLQAVEPLTQTGFAVISSGNYGAVGGYAELFDNSLREKSAVPLSGGGVGIAISTTGIGYVALNSMVGYDTVNTNTGAWITTTDLTQQVSGLSGFNLTSIKLAPDGTLWATDWQDNMVFEINPQTNKVIQTFKLTEPAQDVVFVY
ncbi:MAG: hypothetical protein M1491_07045 [Deltaproteobacteria bacterium]|nr:hypothetical protein [Deltaproteobacteria bacterium]